MYNQDLWNTILSRLGELDKRGPDYYRANCPVHGGHSFEVKALPTGWIFGRCWSGCPGEETATALGLTATRADDDWFGLGPASVRILPPDASISVKRLAEDKGLSEEWLLQNHVSDTTGGSVQIEYRDDRYDVKSIRFRYSPKAKSGSRWRKGDKALPYGLWLLPAWRSGCYHKPDWKYSHKELIIVEGESDCWTLWHAGFAALGLPGASMAGCLTLDHVRQFASADVWCEPDRAGNSFVAGVSSRLREVGFTGPIRVLIHANHKDPNDWWKTLRDREKFQAVFLDHLKTAQSIEEFCLDPAEKLTDHRLVEQMLARTGQDYIYHQQNKAWLYWDGSRYAERGGSKVYRSILAHLDDLLATAQQEQNPARRNEMVKNIEVYRHHRRVDGVLSMLAHHRSFAAEDLDRSPHLLNVLNGMVDLRTSELLPHNRALLPTLVSPVRFEADALSPLWSECLRLWFLGDDELIDYVRRAAGSCLFGLPSKFVFFCYGPGSDNGKSTFLNAVREVLGDYGATVDPKLIEAKKWDSHPAELATLVGKRWVMTTETTEGKYADAALIKRLTGGGRITAHKKFGHPFEFATLFKLWVEGNYRPILRGDDKGVWNRLRVIPFEAKFTRVDRQMSTKLREELPGVLAWLVSGAVAFWRAECSLGEEPECIRLATEQYREDMDTLGQFIEEEVLHTTSEKVTRSEMYNRYNCWCRANEFKPTNSIDFGRKFSAKGFEKDAGKRYWVDVKLADHRSSVPCSP